MKKLALLIILIFVTPLMAAQQKPYRLFQAFNAGELSPLLTTREDLLKYQSGCSIMENMIPLPQGAAMKRPGTKYIAEVKNSSLATRLLSFEYSTTQSYVVEAGNQYMRFFTDDAPVYANLGTEVMSSSVASNIKVHYYCNDNAATTVVADADGATHNATASSVTSEMTTTDAEGTANSAFDLADNYQFYVADHSNFTFGDGTTDSPFSIQAWVYYSDTGVKQHLITKYKNDDREWSLYVDSSDQPVLELYDENAYASTYGTSGTTLNNNTWYYIVATYSGMGGASAANGIKIYVNWVATTMTATNNSSYVAMEDQGARLSVGTWNDGGQALIAASEATNISDMTNPEYAFDTFNIRAAAQSADAVASSIRYVGKDWGAGNTKNISAFRIWSPTNVGFYNGATTVTTTLQGSDDNVTWTNIAASTAADADGLKLMNMSVASTTAYRYHKVQIDTGGGANVYCAELELYDIGNPDWGGKVDNIAIFDKELTSAEIAALATTGTTIYEIETPYLTADLFELKYEQSADVLYIDHPEYEIRELSRLANAIWLLDVYGATDGPFRTQNTDATKTIIATGTTGSVTLSASGHAPFVATAGAGHIPDGSDTTDKAQTGTLFKLVHPLETLEYSTQLEDDYDASTTENVSWMDCGTVYKGATWTFVTGGTWTGVVEVQRNYTIGAAHGASGWETVLTYSSGGRAAGTARNASEAGTEDDGDASYRVIFTDDNSGTIDAYFSTDQTEHIGIVKITSVQSTSVASGMVVETIASSDATYKWSEGSWSNYRGWPRTVAFFEDRLCFGGNISQPDTVWASVTGDYDSMAAGPDDDDAWDFTLSSRQVNVIEWLISKDKLLIGTSGAEWTLEGEADETLTPSNPQAEQHSTYGSANLQATLANESVLFFQRSAENMRELAYNWELDSYIAPDMTILANEVTAGGIVDVTFQKTPDSILWCARDDGEMPIFSYERKEDITAWSRMITTASTTENDSDFESVAVIHGDSEDEVWAIVNRTINGSTARYIEQFQPRNFGSDEEDAFYVDCGITYDSTTASTVITHLSHLENQEVYVLRDGVVHAASTVDNGFITVNTGNVFQIGLPYEVKMRTMPLSWAAQGMTIQGKQKRVNEVIASWYESGDFSVGKDVDTLETFTIASQGTDQDRTTFPPGYDRNGYIYIYQKSAEPLTLLGLAVEFQVY